MKEKLKTEISSKSKKVEEKTMKLFILITSFTLLVLCFGCGDSKVAADKTANSAGSSARENNVNAVQTNAASTTNPPEVDAKLKNIADAFIELPSPNPVENAKKQSYTGITIDIPASWKPLKKFDAGTASGIRFQSPDTDAEAIKVTVGRSYDLVAGDMQTTFMKDAQENIYSKIMLRGINGANGILLMNTKDDSASDYLIWETFPPPDSKGYAVKRYINFSFPNGTYERNKQQITDILLSAKIEN